MGPERFLLSLNVGHDQLELPWLIRDARGEVCKVTSIDCQTPTKTVHEADPRSMRVRGWIETMGTLHVEDGAARIVAGAP